MVRKFSSRFYDAEKEEPWTKNENTKLDKQDRNFIRGIQISQGISKKSAIKMYNQYITGNLKENKKNFRKRAQRAIISGGKSDKTLKFDKKVQKGKKKTPIKKPKAVRQPFASKITRTAVLKKAKSGKYSPTLNKRILTNSKRYPNDTYYQWTHGHGAKKKGGDKNVNKY